MVMPTKPGYYKAKTLDGRVEEFSVLRKDEKLVVGLGKFYDDKEVYREYVPVSEFRGEWL